MMAPPKDCGCYTCERERRDQYPPRSIGRLARIMPLCSECGYKRCPKATHHDNDCTGSNAPGQPGSMYT